MTDALDGLTIAREQRQAPARRGLFRRLKIPRLAVIGTFLVGSLATGSWFVARTSVATVAVVTAASAPGAGGRQPALTAGGYVKDARVVYLVPRISGRIASLSVVEGDRVESGQLVATIESGGIEQEMREARASLDLARANLAKFLAGSRPEEIAEMRAKAESIGLARERLLRDVERNMALFEAGFLSEQAFDDVNTDFLVSERDLDAATQSLALAVAGPRHEEVEMAQAAVKAADARLAAIEIRLGYLQVRSPLSGRVLRKFRETGDFVSPDVPFVEGYNTVSVGSPIVSVADTEHLEAVADINETDVALISLRQQVEIVADTYPDEAFHGVVSRVSPRADKNKNTVEVKVSFESPHRMLAYDTSVKLSFATEETAPRTSGIHVPSKAVFERDGKHFVFVVTEGRALLRQVEVGKRTEETVVVTRGIDEGDQVVVSNFESLQEGTRVKLD